MIDRSGAQSGEFSDLSKVEKFEIPDEVYEKRTGTVSLSYRPSFTAKAYAYISN